MVMHDDNDSTPFRRKRDVVEPKPVPRRRLVTVKAACAYGHFGVTKCYQLMGARLIKGYKSGRQTLIDLNTVDVWLASLPEAVITTKRPER